MSHILRPTRVFISKDGMSIVDDVQTKETIIEQENPVFSVQTEIVQDVSASENISINEESMSHVEENKNTVFPAQEKIQTEPAVAGVIMDQNISEEDVLLEERKKEEEKQEIISDALQKLLDRKIEKAKAEAEASLQVSEISTSIVIPQEDSHMVTVSDAIINDISLKTNVVPVENVTPTVQAVKIPIISTVTPGQEIHTPVQAEVKVEVKDVSAQVGETTTSLSVPVDFYPDQNKNQETVPTIVTPHEAEVIPVDIPNQTIPTVEVITEMSPSTSVVSAVPQVQVTENVQEVHWFDRIFGSKPKNTP